MTKQQKVVFFVGAGFSAPFGLPVMANFIDMARDLYFSDPEKYATVGKTLELIHKYSNTKNYLNINLHNIEDLLSIAYMEQVINGKNKKDIQLINEFIRTVIIEYTTDVSNGMYWFAHYIANVKFTNGDVYRTTYLNNERVDSYKKIFNGKISQNSAFGVVSLNYDLLIENALTSISDNIGRYYKLSETPNIVEEYYKPVKNNKANGIPFAKLHGSIDSEIVPPTWNKNVNPAIQQDWSLAYSLLTEATHVVFLGYSLPQTDNYIKYLLATSLNRNERLKRVSVITKDNNHDVENRYNRLFNSKLVFHNADISIFYKIFKRDNIEIDFDQFDEAFSKRSNGEKI